MAREGETEVMEAHQYFTGEPLPDRNQTDYLLATLPCAEMFLNCSILQANGKESQNELHAVQATVEYASTSKK